MNRKLGLLVGPNAELEAIAVRSAAEYFGYDVAVVWMGRPQQFIQFLEGKLFDDDTALMALCFHGRAGKLVMPRLAEDVYWKDEPQSDIGLEHLEQNALSQKVILSSACTLGQAKISEPFTRNGSTWIAPKDYVDGNAALIFLQNFLYQFWGSEDASLAYQKSRGQDDETAQFSMFCP